MNRFRYLAVLLILSLLVFHFTNKLLPSNLKNKERLARDLKTTPTNLYQWSINDKAPFKYRILFKEVVLNSYHLLGDTDDSSSFFNTYKTWSAIFYGVAIITYFMFLELVGFKKELAFSGCLFMLLSTPYLIAYVPPIHTREDILGYLILLLGLICTVKRKPLFVLLLSVVGFLCRETLLILPLFYFFFSAQEKIWVRYGLPVLVTLAFVGYRITNGVEIYDASQGLQWNLTNPVQVIGFLFLSFGFLWLPYLHSILRWNQMVDNKQETISFFLKSSPFVLLLVLITTFLGGIFNEIRLLFLAFPWIITTTLNFYNQYSSEFASSFRNRYYTIFVLGSLIFFVIIGFFIINNINKYIVPSKYGISYELWATFTFIHLYLATISLPIHIKIERTIAMNKIRLHKN